MKEYKLYVEYDCSELDISTTDKKANKAAGKKSSSSGCFLPTRTRDVEYLFTRKKDMVDAKKRLAKAGFSVIEA